MTLIDIADKIRDFLREHVAPEIQLKAPATQDIHDFQLVDPVVHSVYMPRKGQHYESAGLTAPSILVIPVSGADDVMARGRCDIQLRIAVWDHAHQVDGETLMHTEGWRDLANLIDLIRRKLNNYTYLNGVKLEYPITYGLFDPEEDIPDIPGYFFGWIKFPISYALPGRRTLYDDLL